MVIDVEAKLHYCEGKSITGMNEGLYVYIKFKEDNKLLKTKLIGTLIEITQYTNPIWHPHDEVFDTLNDYYDKVEDIWCDNYYIRSYIEERVMRYFNDSKARKNRYVKLEDGRKKELAKKINSGEKFKIKVDINGGK